MNRIRDKESADPIKRAIRWLGLKNKHFWWFLIIFIPWYFVYREFILIYISYQKEFALLSLVAYFVGIAVEKANGNKQDKNDKNLSPDRDIFAPGCKGYRSN